MGNQINEVHFYGGLEENSDYEGNPEGIFLNLRHNSLFFFDI